jgi:hypothetical protein
MDWAGWPSKMGAQVVPPSPDFQIPPEDAPIYKVSGSPGTPATAEVRFPGGPIYRYFRFLSRSGETVSPAADGRTPDKQRVKAMTRAMDVKDKSRVLDMGKASCPPFVIQLRKFCNWLREIIRLTRGGHP